MSKKKSDQVEDADDEDGSLELKAANLVDALRRHYYSLKIQLSFNDNTHQILNIREVFKKSKWKFKMAFAMKGGGVETGLKCHIPILKNDFFKNHLESFPDCENVFCT